MNSVALIGGAHIHTPGFINRLNARPDVSVASVWDHDAQRAEKCATQLNASVVETPEAILNDSEIEAAIICTETDKHEDLVIATAESGKHLFVEKPLGLSADDAQRMAKAIDKAGVIFQTGYFQRGLPPHLFLKEAVAQGMFGQISRVRVSNCHAGALKDIFTPEWTWMTDPQQAGSGAFGDLGTHALDLLLWIFGPVEAVTASIQSVIGKYGPTCDESGEAILRFANGTIATLAAGWVDVADPVTFQVSGTEGHAWVRDRSELFLTKPGLPEADGSAPWADLPQAWPHAFDLFFDKLSGKEVELITPQEAAYRNQVMERIYQAANAETWLAVD